MMDITCCPFLLVTESDKLLRILEAATSSTPTAQQLKLVKHGLQPHQGATLLRYGHAFGDGLISAQNLVQVSLDCTPSLWFLSNRTVSMMLIRDVAKDANDKYYSQFNRLFVGNNHISAGSAGANLTSSSYAVYLTKYCLRNWFCVFSHKVYVAAQRL